MTPTDNGSDVTILPSGRCIITNEQVYGGQKKMCAFYFEPSQERASERERTCGSLLERMERENVSLCHSAE